MLYLSPLMTAKRRIDRFSSLSRQLVTTSRNHPWLALPLLPPHALLRWLTHREYQKLNQLGYPLTRAKTKA